MSADHTIEIREPEKGDGAAITALVEGSGALDVNSMYLYYLLADHFSETCAIAHEGQRPAGFVTAYRLPKQPDTLFVWQVAVDPAFRGRKIGMSLLLALTKRAWASEIRRIQCTIAPSNAASRRLFRKCADALHGQWHEEPYLTEADLGQGHEAEPLITIELPRA